MRRDVLLLPALIEDGWVAFSLFLSSGILGDTASSSGFLPQIPHCNRDQDYDAALKLSCSSGAHNGCNFSLFPGGFSLGLGWKGVGIQNSDALWPFKLQSAVFTCNDVGLVPAEAALCHSVEWTMELFPAGHCEHPSNHTEHVESFHHALIEIEVHSHMTTEVVSDPCTYRAWLRVLWNGPAG